MQLTELQGVSVRVPLRVSLAGGGTDFPEYFEACQGTTICSVALGYYVHINVRFLSELFDTKFRLEYYEVEHCNEIAEIKNDIIRGVLTLLEWDLPVYVSVVSDLPSSSGLGSSSAFAVGLILALTRIRDGKFLTSEELCLAAIKVELEILNRSMGIQDCLPAAFGGFRIYDLERRNSFLATHEVSLNHLRELVDENCLAMVWTGGQRDSGTVLREQKSQIFNKLASYNRIRSASLRFTSKLIQENWTRDLFRDSLIDVLNLSHAEKMQVSSNAVTPHIGRIIARIDSFGVKAQRLIGAGNGGFILVVSDTPFIDLLKKHSMQFIQPKFSTSGAEVKFEE